MKAQSELMGDHERAAEMTVPRFGGATKWSVRINTMDSANALYDTINAVGTIGLNGLSKTLGCAKPFMAELDSDENEVNYRPAGQQWPVCTP